ncbi:gephyrin-like molybdotransferase Glp [Mongoliimonas terrestris]|uniref:molybdopterin molybdotransferase MoeA n=1 Tax=Mongoliimonas terrestris TaxID=1709001 RepID=UPI00094978B4|nr:gephyrin-like molybdotransferase Glp [Mongoliimonas terrestris]
MALMPVAEAQARMLAGVDPLPAERVPLEAAAGRVLAEDLVALRTQPPFAVSAMDGYAVRAEDLDGGGVLTLVGEAAAGHRFAGTVGIGEAVRIFTGAPMPDGADTVLIQENADRDGASIRPLQAEMRGRHVRREGLDFRAGDRLLSAGTRLDGRRIALAAAANHATLSVRRRPKVALIATGDELVRPGAPIGPNQIVASNGFGLAAMLAALGAKPVDLGIAPDVLPEIRARLATAFDGGADVVCLLGGASVGDHDLTRPALAAEGVDLDFWKIAMRPGKPLMVGRRGAVRALGLPGNPVSTLVCGILFLMPLVRALLGEPNPLPRTEAAVLGGDLRANDQRQDYLRARIVGEADGRPVVDAFDVQDSSMVSTLAAADALIVREPHAPAARAGETCRVIRLDRG